jgi:hypothetical protein
MDAETILIIIVVCILGALAIVQSIRAYMWKNMYNNLVKNIKLGENDGKTEESSTSRGNTEEND